MGSIRSKLIAIGISRALRRLTPGLSALLFIISSTLVCPASTPPGMCWMSLYVAETRRRRNTDRKTWNAVTRFQPIFITSETLCAKSSCKYVPAPEVYVYAIGSISFLQETPWFRIHGGFDQLDDTRWSGQAPSDRGGATEIYQNSRVSKPGQATLSNSVEKSTEVSWGGPTGKAIHPHRSIHTVQPPLDSGSQCPICLALRLARTNHHAIYLINK